MIVLSTLHNLLSQTVTAELHTAVLLTTSGQLIAFASEGGRRRKDKVRMVAGLAMEIWQETQEEFSMVESELGRILVVPVDDQARSVAKEDGQKEEYAPLMLLALNATAAVDWDELQNKGKVVAGHLAGSLGKFREFVVVPRAVLPATLTTSPRG